MSFIVRADPNRASLNDTLYSIQECMLLLGRFDTQISAIHNWALTDLFVAGSAVSVLIRVLHRRRRQDELVEGDRLQRVRARGHAAAPVAPLSRSQGAAAPSARLRRGPSRFEQGVRRVRAPVASRLRRQRRAQAAPALRGVAGHGWIGDVPPPPAYSPPVRLRGERVPAAAHRLGVTHRHAGASGTVSRRPRPRAHAPEHSWSSSGSPRPAPVSARSRTHIETFSTRPRCPGASGSGPSPHPRRAVTTSLSSPYGRVSSPTIQWRPGASRESSQTGSARSNCSRWTARAGPPRCAPPSSEPRATRRGAPTRSHRSTQMPSRTSPSFSTFPKPK